MKNYICGKKFMAAVLTAALAGSVLVVPSYAGTADDYDHGQAKIVLSADKDTVNAGDTVTVAIDLTENDGFVSFQAQLEYDRDVLTMTDFTYGSVRSLWGATAEEMVENSDTSKMTTFSMSEGSLDFTGVLAYVTFTVNEGVSNTETEVGYTVLDCFDEPEQLVFVDVDFEITPVTITIGCDHEWDEGTVTKEATYTETGEITYTCSICGETYTEEIPMLTLSGGDTLAIRRNGVLYLQDAVLSSTAGTTVKVSVENILFGDWDGDGEDEICIRNGNRYDFYFDIAAKEPYASVKFGKSTDEVLSGDWDGNGYDSLCLRRDGNVYYFQKYAASSSVSQTVTFGKSTDEVLSGDWDGDGGDTLCLRRNGNVYYFQQTVNESQVSQTVAYGKSTDDVLAGDWDGDGYDTLCIHRDNVFYMQESITDEVYSFSVLYGKSTDEIYAGRWTN